MGSAKVRRVRPRRCAARSQHQCMAPYSWSVSRISPGAVSVRLEATMLTDAVTFCVKISRRGSPPSQWASRARAVHRRSGSSRTRKSIGSSASRRRSAVTCSNTGRGNGPKEPVLRFVTAGSSSMAARAAAASQPLAKGVITGDSLAARSGIRENSDGPTGPPRNSCEFRAEWFVAEFARIPVRQNGILANSATSG